MATRGRDSLKESFPPASVSVKQIAHLLFFAIYRVIDIMQGRYSGNLLSVEGMYRISPKQATVSPFWMTLHVGKSHRRKRIGGRYEPEVMAALDEHVREDSTFWEVGAWRGYYSIAFASRASEVVAFEAREESAEHVRERVSATSTTTSPSSTRWSSPWTDTSRTREHRTWC